MTDKEWAERMAQMMLHNSAPRPELAAQLQNSIRCDEHGNIAIDERTAVAMRDRHSLTAAAGLANTESTPPSTT